MKRAFLAIAGVISCADITAAEGSPVKIVLTPKTASAACFVADPEPASVKVKQGIAFINHSTAHLTLVLIEDGDDLPLVSVAPGDTSGAVRFNSEGIRQYYSLACGSGLAERHTLAVTVN
ncbi:MAG TPA: hypothetical protein VEB19_06765 [Gemmatimonadaceae bacterium]|nr:hypothetical protein [Gemmatimonadaceae bacterium]